MINLVLFITFCILSSLLLFLIDYANKQKTKAQIYRDHLCELETSYNDLLVNFREIEKKQKITQNKSDQISIKQGIDKAIDLEVSKLKPKPKPKQKYENLKNSNTFINISAETKKALLSA